MTDNENPYAAPGADGFDDHALGDADYAPVQFYVVSLPKLYLLGCTTFGLYKLYWFYAQFRAQGGARQRFVPALAAFFSILTAYGLFRRVDSAARARGLPASPRATNYTVPYIVLSLMVGVVRALGEHKLAFNLAVLGISALGAVPLARVQGIINRTAADPKGAQNSHFSSLNIACVTLGVVINLLAMIGFAQGIH